MLSSEPALRAIATAVKAALGDPSLEVVAEALNCAYDVFGADGPAISAVAKSEGLASSVATCSAAAASRLRERRMSMEPDARERCEEMLANAGPFVVYLRGAGAA
tara:strand:- start:1136 stop:1450 length:315 start_codon:yes stop_codon:yes gene_type:complete